MKMTSKAYREEINQPVRGMFAVRVSIGVVSMDAQTNAKINNPSDYFISDAEIFDDREILFPYASFEKDQASADGLIFFPPEVDINEALFNGYIVDTLSDAEGNIEVTIDFSFPQEVLPLEVKGLTLDFGDYSHPTNFIVRWDGGVKEYSNSVGYFADETTVFSGIRNQFSITFSKMSLPHSRLRIRYMMFGVGLLYDDSIIQKVSLKTYTNPVSNKLPTVDMSMDIINKDYEYDLENPSSRINFLEEQQDGRLAFGYQLKSGTWEWFNMAAAKLKTWSAEQYTANFKFEGLLNFFDADYYKGVYSDTGRSLYDLFIDVVTDMGLDPWQYAIDDYYKTIITHNPIPICKHAEALQMIANAGCGYLSYDANGVLVLNTNFIPDYSFFAEDKAPYSNVSLLKKGWKNHYATFGNNETDQESFFLPEGSDYIDIAYVSQSMSDGSGYFSTTPEITISLESGLVTMGIILEFGNTVASEFEICTYLKGVQVEAKQYTNSSAFINCNRSWQKFDKVILRFLRTAEGNQHINVNRISFGELSDYYVSFREYIEKTPKGTVEEKVKTLYVTATRFAKQGVEEEISSVDFSPTDSGLYETITFDEPRYDIRVENAVLIESGSYYVKIQYASVAEDSTAHIYGKKFALSYVNVARAVHEKGTDKYFSNDLVDDVGQAKLLARWLGDYVFENKQYEFDWRGDPCVDSNDIVYIQNRYNDRMPFRIMNNEITYNQNAYSGKIKGRRVYVDAAEDKLGYKGQD